MKPAYYLLAVVLLLVGTLAVLVFVTTGNQPQQALVSPPEEIYVDLDRLVANHPAQGVLGDLARSVADRSGFDLPAARPVPAAVRHAPEDWAREAAARKRLEAATVRDAVVSLSRLEVVRLESLDARLRLRRSEMAKRAADDTEALIREIEAQRSAELRAAADQTAHERINLIAGIAGLNSKAKTISLDQQAVIEAIAREETALRTLEEKRAAELASIEDRFRRMIGQVSLDTEAEISAALSELEQQGVQAIESDIRLARERLLGDLSARNGWESHRAWWTLSSVDSGVKARVTVSAPEFPGQSSVAPAIGGSLAEIRSALRENLARGVKVAAEQEGLAVGFVRKKGVPDRTAMMLKLMQKRSWGAWELSSGGAL